MNWLQAIQRQKPKHKYEINAKRLGDAAELAWTNLGYWDNETEAYPQACLKLAEHLAQAIQLNQQDRVLDLGCGKGASLKYWIDYYQIRHLSAVELQQACVEDLEKKFDGLAKIYCQSFLNLDQIHFNDSFDCIFCIDAVYHSCLNLFLDSIDPVLAEHGRLGFHCLILTEKWQHASTSQKMKTKYLLKAADIQIDYLKNLNGLEKILQGKGFKTIKIEDISKNVLGGFARYYQNHLKPQQKLKSLDDLKIKMTAMLCQQLYQDGLIRYVQVVAIK